MSGPRQHLSLDQSVGQLHILPKRKNFCLLEGTFRNGVPAERVRDIEETSGPPLFEQTTYDIWISSPQGKPVELRHRDPSLLGSLHTSQNQNHIYGHINFAGQVGLSRFSVFVERRPELDLEIEVFPSKLNFRADYAAMLSDVHSLVAGLALEYLRATHQLGMGKSGSQGSRLEWLALVRHLMTSLEQALYYINNYPTRGLKREDQTVRAEALRRSDAKLRKAIQAGKGQGPFVAINNKIPVRRRLPEQRPIPTLDTPEHRWLALQLHRIRQDLARTAREERKRQFHARNNGSNYVASGRDRQSLFEVEQLERRVANLEGLPPIAEAVGSPPPPGFASLQMQGSPGYREAYQTILKLRQGLSIRGGPTELSLKDIHLLYEYWCFLGLLQAVSEILETNIPADRLLEVHGEGLRILLRQGRTQSVPFKLPGERHLEVTYNPSFQGTESLLPQKPDFVLTLYDPYWSTVRLVLDAKYRVQNDVDSINRFGVASPPPDAINVLHRYRDAILESQGDPNHNSELVDDSRVKRTVVEGAVLYPLDAQGSQNFDQTRLWDSLRKLGIGALPFLPGSTFWVKHWLCKVLQRCGWNVAESVIPHTAEIRKAKWKKDAEDVVLVAVLRGGQEQTHLDWIKREKQYYTRLTPSQPRQYRTKIVTFYLPASAKEKGSSGAVTHWAEVKDVEVIARKNISTPWLPGRDPEELQVRYRLGPVKPLSKEILNRNRNGKGQRFSTNRWSSRLALLRASHVNELLLESAAEWELYESLCARGVQFDLHAIPPGRGKHSNIPGRVWFVFNNYRCRYIGGHKFEFSVKNGVVREINLRSLIQKIEKDQAMFM